MTTLHARTGPVLRRDAVRQSLTVGLHAVTEFNQSIRYADTKAAALAAAQALAVTVLAARRDTGAGELPGRILFTAGLAGVLVSAVLLAAGQAPRLSHGTRADGPNRIAFPSLAMMDRADALAAPSIETQHADVWRQAAQLAAIAMTKYRWLHRAMASTLCTLATVLSWLGVTTWLS